jgi:hypothetical protein
VTGPERIARAIENFNKLTNEVADDASTFVIEHFFELDAAVEGFFNPKAAEQFLDLKCSILRRRAAAQDMELALNGSPPDSPT